MLLDNFGANVTLPKGLCQENSALKFTLQHRWNIAMKNNDLYSQAHLFTSAIRILMHQNQAPPTLDAISDFLRLPGEHTALVLRKLMEVGAVKTVEGAYGGRVLIEDHLAIETIPRQKDESRLDMELKKFKEDKNKMEKKVDSIKAEQKKKQKDLFAQLEQNLKKDLNKK